MSTFKVLEVVSGLGMGGAERALLNRLKYVPSNFKHVVLNVRPEIDVLALSPRIEECRISRRGLLRGVDTFRFLRQGNFDVVVVRTPLDAIRFVFLRAISPNSVPKLIFEAHNNFVSTRFGVRLVLRSLLQICLRKIDLVIAVSENVLQGPQCRGHKNAHVVYLGAELGTTPKLQQTPELAHLIFVGRLVNFKRPIWLLERLLAVRTQLPLRPRVLTIVGAGPLEKEVQTLISRHGLEDAVSFIGKQEDVTPHLMSATHLVSSSTNEGLPLVFFEAKLAGLAILATPSGGGAEIFGDEDQELQSLGEEEFEAALKKVITTPPPSFEERQQIQSKSSWMSAEQCAKRYYSILSQLLSVQN